MIPECSIVHTLSLQATLLSSAPLGRCLLSRTCSPPPDAATTSVDLHRDTLNNDLDHRCRSGELKHAVHFGTPRAGLIVAERPALDVMMNRLF